MIPSMFKMMYICHAWHFDSADLWNQVLYKVEDISQYYEDIRSRNMGLGKNHPLVNRKFAYWVDENTLCIGYTLKSNPSVFRSVYKPGRMKYMREKILHNIPIVFKKREKYLKYHGHKEIFKLTKIPEDVINIIMDFV
jgi:hypothetical protein